MTNAPSEDHDSRYEHWTKFEHRFGGLLVAGLTIEMTLAFFVHESWVIRGFTLLSDALIVIGVGGEIWAGNQARLAGDAIVEEARAKIAESNRTAAEANLRAEKARERAALIQAATSWRKISFEREGAILSAFKEYSPLTVGLAFMTGDPESMFLAYRIAEIIRTANGKASSSRETHFMVPYFGLKVGTSTMETPTKLLDAFKGIGIDAEYMPGALTLGAWGVEGQAATLAIFVAPKQPPNAMFEALVDA